MTLSIIGTILAIVAMLVPVLLEKRKDRQDQKDLHEALDEADQYIAQYLKGDPRALIELSRQLSRLQHEAARKRHHTGQ